MPFCNYLPISPNGPKKGKGCPGAVYSNGSPAKRYCDGEGGKRPWYKECCTWKGGKCVAKDIGIIKLFVFLNAA